MKLYPTIFQDFPDTLNCHEAIFSIFNDFLTILQRLPFIYSIHSDKKMICKYLLEIMTTDHCKKIAVAMKQLATISKPSVTIMRLFATI